MHDMVGGTVHISTGDACGSHSRGAEGNLKPGIVTIGCIKLKYTLLFFFYLIQKSQTLSVHLEKRTEPALSCSRPADWLHQPCACEAPAAGRRWAWSEALAAAGRAQQAAALPSRPPAR